jgi:hypothetical protein
MKAQILKIAGVKNEKEFYKKFPTEEAFLKKHGKELKKAQNGYQSTITPTDDEYQLGMNAPMSIEESARRAKDEQKANYNRMVSYANQYGVMQDNPDVNPAAAIKTPSTSKGIDWKGGGNALLSDAGDIIQSIQMVKASQEKGKQLLQGKELSSLGVKAAATKDTNKRYNLNNHPEKQRFSADQMGNTYGIGTNYLGQAEDGAMIGGNPGEIANYYTYGNTIYSDLGYEPLNDSSQLKQFAMGGMFGGQDMSSQTGNLGNAIGSLIGGGGFEANPEGKLGSDIGGLVGSFIPVPGAREVLSLVGGGIGGAIGGEAAKERRGLQQQSSNDFATMAYLNSSDNSTLGTARKDGGPVNGGWVSNDWMPQTITTFGEHKMSDLLRPPHDAEMLRAGGHLKEYTPPSERAMYTGRFQDGGRTAYNGDVEVGSNGGLKPLADNLYEITGDRHSAPSGGVILNNGQNSQVMAEGTETIRKDVAADGSTDGSLTVIGNRKANDYLKEFVDSDIYKVNKGTTMKNISKDLGKIVTKSNQKADKAMQMISDLDVRDAIDKITLKSLELQAKGNQQKSQIADGQIDALVAYQNATGDMADQLGIEINAFDKGKIVPLTEKEKKAAFGAKLSKAQDGKKVKYDPEFENFIDQAIPLEVANSYDNNNYVGGGSNFGTNKDFITSKEKAKEYYYKNYWSKVKDLPPGLRTRALQLVINTGDPYGELLVAGKQMSVGKRREAILEADKLKLTGSAKDNFIQSKRLKENQKEIDNVVDQYKKDPQGFLSNLDAEQDRYYDSVIANNPLNVNSDTRKDFYNDYVGLARYASQPYIPNIQAASDVAPVATPTPVETPASAVTPPVPMGMNAPNSRRWQPYGGAVNTEVNMASPNQPVDARQALRPDLYAPIGAVDDVKNLKFKPYDAEIFSEPKSKKAEQSAASDDWNYKNKSKKKFPWEESMLFASSILPSLLPTNQMPLNPQQLLGENYALSQNQLRPVFARSLQPMLTQPFEISGQAELNANQADFNALQRQLGGEPEALAALAAQKYAANANVISKYTAMNQAERARAYNANREIMNEADRANYAIAVDQADKQAKALSNTFQTNIAALQSAAAKQAQNQLENRTLGVYENMYRYRFGPNGQAYNMNNPVAFNTSRGGTGSGAAGKIQGLPSDWMSLYDEKGEFQGTKKKKKDANAKNGAIVNAFKKF